MNASVDADMLCDMSAQSVASDERNIRMDCNFVEDMNDADCRSLSYRATLAADIRATLPLNNIIGDCLTATSCADVRRAQEARRAANSRTYRRHRSWKSYGEKFKF